MSGWAIAMIGGAVAIVLVAALCAFVLRALRTTAETTQELAKALEQVQANTAALAQLDVATTRIERASQDLAAAAPPELPERPEEPVIRKRRAR